MIVSVSMAIALYYAGRPANWLKVGVGSNEEPGVSVGILDYLRVAAATATGDSSTWPYGGVELPIL